MKLNGNTFIFASSQINNTNITNKYRETKHITLINDPNMATKETNTEAILESICHDIKEHAHNAEAAFATMEKMNVTPEEYKKANWQFCLNSYVVRYLDRFMGMAALNESLKTIESRMRFHAHQQRTKGALTDKQEISAAQATVAVLLDGYIEKFFEAE